LADKSLKSTIRNFHKKNQTISPKQLLPSIHNKTHFKAATSIFLGGQLEGSLKDKSNFLSRALRDVSPSFATSSMDKLTQPKTPNVGNTTQKDQSVIKKHHNKGDKKNITVSFMSGEPSLSEKIQNSVPHSEEVTDGSKGKLLSLNNI